MNDTGIFLFTIIVFVWLLSAWEALLQLSGGQARRIENKNRNLAKIVEEWVDNKRAYDTVFRFLILLTVCFLAISIYTFIIDYFSTKPLHLTAILLSVATFIFILFTELLTRVFVYKYDIALLRITMPVIKILKYSILFPIVYITTLLDEKAEDRNSNKDEEAGKTSTEDEIMSLVEQDSDDDDDSSLEEDEKRMIRGVFELDNTAVREIMTPRVDVKSLQFDSTISDAIELFTTSGHSRIPIFSDSIDDINGILYAKDFLNRNLIKDKKLVDLARRPIFIPETKEVGDLLEEIQKSRRHFAVVIDEYGGTAGIVTLEDIIEEIVGEIRDEYDQNEDDTPMYVAMPDGSFVFDARTLISDVNDILDGYIPDGEEVDTIGGFVCGELGHIPEPGEELVVEEEEYHIKVLKADNKRILTLKITKKDKDD